MNGTRVITLKNKSRSEIVFGLVGPLGVDLDQICNILDKSLDMVGYGSEKIVISDLFTEIIGLENPERNDSKYDRIESRMNRGDELRNRMGGNSAAVLAVKKIQKSRKTNTEDIAVPFPNHAYVLKSLKHIEEVEELRKIYGRNFWLISAFLSKKRRTELLEERLGSDANRLINRDYHDDMEKLGQGVRDTFPEGDVFVDASDPKIVEKQINRFIELIFGNTFLTPYREEHGMFHAFASSLRSSSLSRQVGAAILDKEGNLISTGINDVPKAGGGTYSADQIPDVREFTQRQDSNQQKKLGMLKDVFSRLRESGWFRDEYQGMSDSELVDVALETDKLRGIKFMDITEYGREIHAEMDALIGATRRNESIKNCTMYCTTFPCHICAKHIISSGIDVLVFIEPYPKSHADDLFSDSISIEDAEAGKVHFKPYFGISPKRYVDLFTMGKRKDKKTGKMIPWIAAQSSPIFAESLEFVGAETLAVRDLVKRMEEKGLYKE